MKSIDHTDTFILPAGKHQILYAPLRGVSAVSDALGIQYLFDILVEKDSGQVKRHAVRHLLDGFSGSDPCYPEEAPEEIRPYFLGLLPTRSCNGNCSYCGFDIPESQLRDMDDQMAITAIDWMADRMIQLGSKDLKIHFFGGEPLMAPDTVSVAVHYARYLAHRLDLVPFFEISTNGQVSDATSRFVAEHMDAVVLSIDGKEEVQNLHRPLKNGKGSFEGAVRFAKLISRSGARLLLRACVSNKNVALLPEITQWFCETFQPSMITFENLKPRKDATEMGILEPDPYEFVSSFSASQEIAESYGVPLINSSTSSETPQYSSCPVGKDTVIVDPMGNIHSCYLLPDRWKEKGLDLSIGRIKDNRVAIDMKQVSGLRNLAGNKPRCRNCFCKWTCAGGCHVDVTYPGSGRHYDNYCLQTRMLWLIKILKELGQMDMADEMLRDEALLLKFAQQESDRIEDWPKNGNA